MERMDAQDNDFVWPDDPNFRNFPKHLPEDCVEYTIHVLDTSLDGAALRSRLLEIQAAAQKLQRDLLKGYIWQREAFNLSLSEPFTKAPASSLLPDDAASQHNVGEPKLLEEAEERVGLDRDVVPLHLHGRCSFGDSIADEWLVVFILRQLSTQFPAAWVRVWDKDGEFLLIEAANVLPRWINPEVAEHRVWIRDGKLYIIPLKADKRTADSPASNHPQDSGLPRTVTLAQALSYLASSTSNPQDHLLPNHPAIEKEAFHRIRSHPSAIPSNLHTAIITIPRKLSYLLNRSPAWISPAIEVFYLRDPIALKPLQRTTKGAASSLTFPPEDFVDVPVKFTRVGFAQLRGQDFPAPRAWANARYPKAVADNVKQGKSEQRQDIGMKLTCGFEMLLSDPAHKDSRAVREMQLVLSDLAEGEEELPSDAELQQWREKKGEDSEAWLDVNFEDFEKELRGQGNRDGNAGAEEHDSAATAHSDGAKEAVSAESGFGDEEAQENLRRMVQRFEDFLKDDSAGADGAEENDFGMDEMDFDDDDDDDNDENTEDEDDDEHDADSNEVEKGEPEQEFTDEQLEEMIREMKSMGLKPPPAADAADDEVRSALLALADLDDGPAVPASASNARTLGIRDLDPTWHSRALDPEGEVDDGEDEDDDVEELSSDEENDEDVSKLARAMEAELRSSGALDMDASSAGGQDPRYLLAKHLLESYKGQAGMSGPTGNLMGALGIKMPRDEGGSSSKRHKK